MAVVTRGIGNCEINEPAFAQAGLNIGDGSVHIADVLQYTGEKSYINLSIQLIEFRNRQGFRVNSVELLREFRADGRRINPKEIGEPPTLEFGKQTACGTTDVQQQVIFFQIWCNEINKIPKIT